MSTPSKALYAPSLCLSPSCVSTDMQVHFCWDSIDGGWTRQALEDLTGGLAYTLDLRRKDAQKYGGSDHSAFKAICDDPLTVLGCAVGNHVREAAGAGRAGEQGAVYGLFKGHAYSVLKCSVTSDGQAFVRVRNPWGNDAEWTGPYSDRSSEWNRNPIHKRELAPEMKADGAFWMPWDYFRYASTVRVCLSWQVGGRRGTGQGCAQFMTRKCFFGDQKSKTPNDSRLSIPPDPHPPPPPKVGFIWGVTRDSTAFTP